MSVWLLAGVVVYLAGLVATFARAGLRGRVVGLAVLAAGAGIAVVSAPPTRSWQAAVTVAATVAPTLLIGRLSVLIGAALAVALRAGGR